MKRKRKDSEVFYNTILVTVVLLYVALPSYSQVANSIWKGRDPVDYSLLDNEGKELTQERYNYLITHGFNDELWTKGKRYASFGRFLEFTGFCMAFASGVADDRLWYKNHKEINTYNTSFEIGGIAMIAIGQFFRHKGTTIIRGAFGSLDIDVHPRVGPGLVGIILDF